MLAVNAQLRPFEEECLNLSEKYIAESASLNDATHAFNALLHHLYLYSCCFWGCQGKEHVLESLAGRTVSHSIACYRLILNGYYDESLSLIRNIGEIANLLNLFWADNELIRSWLNADDKARRREFSAVAVRKKLEARNWMIPFDQQHYESLCDLVHPSPLIRPNAHQNSSRPVLGAYFQEVGFLRASWELYWSVSVVAAPVAKLAVMPREQAEKMVELTIPVANFAFDHIRG